MKTVETIFNDNTTLLIKGIKGKVNNDGTLLDTKTNDELVNFIVSFKKLIFETGN